MDIKGYVLGIFGICVASAVARVICAGEATKKHIEMLTSLCLSATVASPLASFIGDADGISGIFDFEADTPALDYGALYEEYLLYGNAETSEMILEGELASLLSVSDGAFDVRLTLGVSEGGVAEVRAASVIIYPKGIAADPDKIREHILMRTGAECEIIYDIND